MEIQTYKIEQITINHDKKRKPLSAQQRSGMKGNYRYYGAQNVIDYVGDYLFDGEYLLIAEDGENLKSNKQNIAQIVEGQFWLNNHAHIVQTNNLCNIRYLCYWLNTADISGYITGSAQPKLSQGNLNAIEIKLPERNIQDKIVDIIYAFDKKIEANEAINKNLEEQAQAIFRTYFIDYLPYGGKAPADWIYTTLGDVCIKVTDGSHYSPTDDESGIYPMYSVKDMETYGFNPSSCKHIGEDEFNKMLRNDCVPQVNDILVAKDGSYLKEIFICTDGNKEAILSSIAIFRPNTEIILPEILLFLLKQPSIRKDVGDNYVSGSALPRIVLKDFKKYSILLPSITEQKQIGELLNSIRMQTHVNAEENRRLSLLRDTLLPKLMSGELDVSDSDI